MESDAIRNITRTSNKRTATTDIPQFSGGIPYFFTENLYRSNTSKSNIEIMHETQCCYLLCILIWHTIRQPSISQSRRQNFAVHPFKHFPIHFRFLALEYPFLNNCILKVWTSSDCVSLLGYRATKNKIIDDNAIWADSAEI